MDERIYTPGARAFARRLREAQTEEEYMLAREERDNYKRTTPEEFDAARRADIGRTVCTPKRAKANAYRTREGWMVELPMPGGLDEIGPFDTLGEAVAGAQSLVCGITVQPVTPPESRPDRGPVR